MTACVDCGKGISPGAKRCQKHANALRNRTPEMREVARREMTAKQAAGIGRNDAAVAAKLRELYADPANRLRLVEMGVKGRRAADNPVSQAKRAANQSATKQAQRAKRLEWCPVDRRDEYQRLTRSFPVAEARRIIEADEIAKVRRAMGIAA